MSTFKIHKRFKQKEKPSTDLYCPHCHQKLYNWKERNEVTIFKCGNRKCPCRTENLKKLNPSERLLQKLYPTHFKLKHKKVIGLENLDEESSEYRFYKQMIERLNRTFKQHVRQAAGFEKFNGAMVLLTLFVTYYNIMRPHMSLNYNTPVPLEELKKVSIMPAKWIKILSTVSTDLSFTFFTVFIFFHGTFDITVFPVVATFWTF